MQNRTLNPTSLLAVLVLLVTAFLLCAVPVSAKTALGGSSFNLGLELEKTVSKSLLVLEESFFCRRAASGICDGPDNNVVPPPKRNTGETVLGSYPEYVELSDDLNARRFEIPTEQWNKMTPQQQWTANQKFLDRTVNRGDSIRLSNNARDAKPGTYFHREIQYMQSKGYSVSNDGMSLLAPKQ